MTGAGQKDITRREFIRTAAATAGALTLLGTDLAWAQPRPVRGGTLKIAFSAIQQIDPFKTGGKNDEINASSLMFDPLINISKDNFKPAPLLASRWETPDVRTWIFHLRQGVLFQDGNEVFPSGTKRELTAEDVVYSINRFIKVSTAFTLGEIDSVTAMDRYTVRLKTVTPNPFLISDPNRLARVGIVPREAVEKLGEDGFAQHPIGSGPFKIEEFVPNQRVTFVRNDRYWLPVYPDRVEFVYLPDPTVATIALQGGQTDVIPYLLNVDSVRDLSRRPGIQLIARGGSYRGLGFNVRTAPFNERPVRDAISKALNIDTAVNSVLGPYAQRAYGQVPPWVPFGYDPTLKSLWTNDPRSALKELAEVGFTEKTGDGILARRGQPLRIQIKVIAGSQVRVLTILVTQLRELGIDASLLQQDVATWAADLVGGKNTGVFFDFSYAGTTGLFELFHSRNIGRSNTHFYANERVDSLLDEALRTNNQARQSLLWKMAQQLIMQDRVAIPLYHEQGYSAVRARVHDWVPPWGGLRLVSPENSVYLTS